MVEKKADITAVARAAKVSPSTVSRAFNHPELVKGATRKRIDSAVRRLGYIRNRAAQTIHGIRSGTIGVIVPTIDHAIFAELIQSFSDAVEAKGFTILVASHGYDLEREYALTRKMLEHRVDGMALVGVEHAPATFDLLQSQDTPTVLLWNHAADAAFPCVGADNFEAGHMIGTHVAGLGHRDIAILFPPVAGNDRATQRRAGVEAALRDYDITLSPKRCFETLYNVGAAKRVVTDMLAMPDAPTALICGNDVLAWGALHALSARGVSIPGAMSVAGIGDFKGSRDFEPALTTVQIPAREIGAQAADVIVSRVTSPDAGLPAARIDVSLICRATTAAPPVR